MQCSNNEGIQLATKTVILNCLEPQGRRQIHLIIIIEIWFRFYWYLKWTLAYLSSRKPALAPKLKGCKPLDIWTVISHFIQFLRPLSHWMKVGRVLVFIEKREIARKYTYSLSEIVRIILLHFWTEETKYGLVVIVIYYHVFCFFMVRNIDGIFSFYSSFLNQFSFCSVQDRKRRPAKGVLYIGFNFVPVE